MRRLLPLLLISMTILLFISCGDSGPAERNPMISEIQPESGPPGISVTISGSDFSPTISENSITFGGVSAEIQEAGESQLVAAVPDSAETGPVEVAVDGSIAAGPQFTVESEAPGISSVKPDSGTIGTEVIITGMNFSATASENTITFGGTQAQVNTATEDQLKTEVPQGAIDGPIKVTVKQKSTTGPDFDVITTGTMELVTITSGFDKDSDGFTASVDGGSGESVAIDDTSYFANLEEGSHNAELTGIAQNCAVSGNNPRDVSISAGDTTTTAFDINCQVVAKNQIAFHSNRSGNSEIYLMNTDGSNPQKITNNSATDHWPSISNDGTKIAFTSTRNGYVDLYVMDVDGTNIQQLTSSSGSIYVSSWSSDDSKIVFRDNRSGNEEIYTVNVDGSEETRLTDNSSSDFNPSWSPDGNKIVFASDRDGVQNIYTMNTDGTGIRQITNSTASDNIPRWSPDGSKILFSSNRDGNFEVYTMNADGTGVLRITNNSADDQLASWSPDGSEIVFESNRSGNFEIYKVNADGSGPLINMTANLDVDRSAYWSPVE